tara:strand:- start:236 stop:451 length:216 start_codon:yes stop_codon:yes gene_type:complete
MTKGYIFDLMKMENGWVITLFSIFKFGYLNNAYDFGIYKCFQIGIYKLELTFSLSWDAPKEFSFTNTGGIS